MPADPGLSSDGVSSSSTQGGTAMLCLSCNPSDPMHLLPLLQVRFLDVHSALLSLAMTAGEQLTINLQRWFAGADSLNLSHVLAHHRKAASQLAAESRSSCKAGQQGSCKDTSAEEVAADDADAGVAGGSSGGNKQGTGADDSNQGSDDGDSSAADAALDDDSGVLGSVMSVGSQQDNGECQGGGKGGQCATRDTEGSTRGRDHEVGE